jgi:hypothetical protein
MHEADNITGLGQRVLIAQPSRQLVAETEKRLRDFSRRPVHRFDSDTCGSGRVKAALADHLMHHADPGQIVLTTHTALLTLPYFHRREDWHVIIDEIPSGHEGYQLNLAEEHRILTDHVEIREDGRSNASTTRCIPPRPAASGFRATSTIHAAIISGPISHPLPSGCSIRTGMS